MCGIAGYFGRRDWGPTGAAVLERIVGTLRHRGSDGKGIRCDDPLSQAQYLETAHLLPGHILSSQDDRMAMAHGVEGRFPLLDHLLVAAAARIPPRMKIKGLQEKAILGRRLGAKANRKTPKQPYRAPESQSEVSAVILMVQAVA